MVLKFDKILFSCTHFLLNSVLTYDEHPGRENEALRKKTLYTGMKSGFEHLSKALTGRCMLRVTCRPPRNKLGAPQLTFWGEYNACQHRVDKRHIWLGHDLVAVCGYCLCRWYLEKRTLAASWSVLQTSVMHHMRVQAVTTLPPAHTYAHVHKDSMQIHHRVACRNVKVHIFLL